MYQPLFVLQAPDVATAYFGSPAMSDPVSAPAAHPDFDRGRAAFAGGQWSVVRDLFQPAAVAGTADAESTAMLAWACLRLGDDAAADAFSEQALNLDGSNLRVLLVRADVLTARGAKREANLYYRAVIAHGTGDLPPDLAEGVARARALQSRLAADMSDHLREELQQAGYVEGRSSARFTHALDLMTGRRQAYFQQPQAFFFPELPHIQFYPRDMFPWMDRVEAATDEITQELEAVLAGDTGFSPYLRTVPNLQSRTDYPLVDSMDWSTCHLWKDGAATANAPLCPKTMDALSDAPLCRIAARSPQVMFSQLKAGAHILPHTGFVNTRLICHLPLVVPDGCKFRVGNEVRQWERGKAWVFDDTIEHEAINSSDRTRVVLIFDIWRPELTEEERVLVTAVLEALDAYAPTISTWE